MKKQIIGLTIIILVSVLSFPKVITRPGGFMQLYPVTPNQGIIISANGNVGIGTTAPSVKLDVAGTISASALVVNGSIAEKYSRITGSTTLDSTHYLILADALTTAITLTLPDVASCVGRRYSIKKIDASANTVILDASGSETMDGKLSHVLNLQYEFIDVVSDGTTWFIMGVN